MMPQPASKSDKAVTAPLDSKLLDSTNAHREAPVAAWALAESTKRAERERKMGKKPTWRDWNHWEDLARVNLCVATKKQKKKV